MGKKLKTPATESANLAEQSLEIRLSDPGMTGLHRVGLAGLWMTLQAFERVPDLMARFAAAGASWTRNTASVLLRWKDQDSFFKTLFEEAYQLDKNGLVWFAGIGEPSANLEHALILQKAMLSTFLQHNQNRKVLKKSKSEEDVISVTIDNVTTSLPITRLESYEHQAPRIDWSSSAVGVAGWLLPGGADRHSGLGGNTKLEENLPRALCLSFAPQGAIFFELQRRTLESSKSAFALVIPECDSLETYARSREAFVRFGTCQLRASGASDAGLRALVELDAARLLHSVQSSSCRVMIFGSIPWSSQQKTRIDLVTIRTASQRALREFAFALRCFPSQVIARPGKPVFVDTPQMPDLIAANLTGGYQWWRGFAAFIQDDERREHIFSYERFGPKNTEGGLAQMVSNPETFPDSPERVFVQVCHTAWRARLGQIGARARKEGASFSSIAGREFEHLRVTFSRCKNAATLREAITDFWARAGRIPELQDRWETILPLISEERWREGRDLALLALASYKPANKSEEEALSTVTPESPEGDEE
jgi:CRISPR-associated protein Cas8a1/Csx13